MLNWSLLSADNSLYCLTSIMVIDFSHIFIPNLFMNCTNAITLSVLLQLPNFSTVTPAYLRIGPVRTGAEMDMWVVGVVQAGLFTG